MNILEIAKKCGAKVFGDRIVVTDGGSSGEATQFCEAFAKEIAEQSNSRWISVDTALPEDAGIENITVGHSKAVLGFVTDNLCCFCVTYEHERKAWRYFDDIHNIVWHEITHWQPLPEPPKD